MDKIYSRHRIKIYKFKPNNTRRKTAYKKTIKLGTILLIAFLTVYTILKSLNPIFEGLCISKATIITSNIVNGTTRDILAKYQYKDLVQVIHNDSDNTNILKADVATINQIISEISLEITNKLSNMDREDIQIHLGAITGNRYFSWMGPAIDIKIRQTGKVETDIKTEFESIGINQSIYRIYMEITTNMNILTPYKTIGKQTTNKVLLVETVIVGEIPETYYNLEGMSTDDTMNMM